MSGFTNMFSVFQLINITVLVLLIFGIVKLVFFLRNFMKKQNELANTLEKIEKKLKD